MAVTEAPYFTFLRLPVNGAHVGASLRPLRWPICDTDSNSDIAISDYARGAVACSDIEESDVGVRLRLTHRSSGQSLRIPRRLTYVQNVCIMLGMAEKRTDRLHVLISTDERKMLEELAEEGGVTESDIVRQLVRREHAARFGVRKKTKR